MQQLPDGAAAGQVTEIVGAVAGVVAAVFAYLAWRAGRTDIKLEFRVERGQSSTGAGPWGLHITARSRRGSRWVGGLVLQGKRGGVTARGTSPVGDTTHGITLGEGAELSWFVPVDEYRRLVADAGPVVACWTDAKHHHHCSKVHREAHERLMSADPGGGLLPRTRRRWRIPPR